MATRKKTTKKKISERNYSVKRTGADGTDVSDDMVSAGSSSEAAEKALKGGETNDDKIVVQRDKGNSHVRTKPNTVSQVKPKTKPQASFESVEYPYGLGLPLGWKPLFESLSKKVFNNLVIGEQRGKLYIQVPNSKVMEALVTEMDKKARGKTAVKHMASSVLDGINESVNI
jgi:hypothetical protein